MKQFKIALLLTGILVSGAAAASESINTDDLGKISDEHFKKTDLIENNQDIFENTIELPTELKNFIQNANLAEICHFMDTVLHTQGEQAYKNVYELLTQHPELFLDALSLETGKLAVINGYYETENEDLKTTISNLQDIISQSEEFAFYNMLMHLYNVHPTKTVIISSMCGISVFTTLICFAKNAFSRFSKTADKQNQKKQDISYLLQY